MDLLKLYSESTSPLGVYERHSNPSNSNRIVSFKPCEELIRKPQVQRRLIGHFELASELRFLSKFGVQVPTLLFSEYCPRFVGFADNGDELYAPGFTRVPEGHVIDNHGNVVNLEALEKEVSRILLTSLVPLAPVIKRYNPACIMPEKFPSERKPTRYPYGLSSF